MIHRSTWTPLLGLACMLLLSLSLAQAQTLHSENHHFDGTGVSQVSFQDYFGYAVAASSQYVVAGAYANSAPGFVTLGAAYVFERTDDASGWATAEVLRPGSMATATRFGQSVAVSGDRVLVAAPFAKVGLYQDCGAAHLFQRHAGRWLERAVIVPEDVTASKRFGQSIAIQGDRVVVGAPGDVELGVSAGAAYVFEHGSNGWQQVAKLLPPPGLSSFGRCVDLDQETVVVGTTSGKAVCVYREDPLQGWILEQILTDPSPGVPQEFATSVAVHGDTIVVGQPVMEGLFGCAGPPGTAYVFTHEAGTWSVQAEIQASDEMFACPPERFGQSVDIRGDRVLVGVPYASPAGEPIGRAYVFERRGVQWLETRKLERSTAAAYDATGRSVALAEGLALVGATYAETLPGILSGAAFGFDLPLGQDFCSNPANSSGQSARLEVLGSPVLDHDQLRLQVTNLPPGQSALCIASLASTSLPAAGGGQGTLCLGLPILRLLPMQSSGAAGMIEANPLGLPLQPGSTWHFQCWYRDLNPGPTTNLSQSVLVPLY